MIEHSTPALVGVLGHPSDGYGGRTLGLAIPTLTATVTLVPGDGVEIEQNEDDRSQWSSLSDLVNHVDRYGYATGPQLLTAAVRTFVDVARSLDGADGSTTSDSIDAGFRLSYQSSIPRQVGLGGSSALVISALRCLCSHTGLEIPDHVLASIALRVETEQLGSQSFGLQDRVVQCLGGAVAMNFGATDVDAKFGVAFGHYEPIELSTLPPLFVAYREAVEPGARHSTDSAGRFDVGEPFLRDTMKALAGVVVEGVASLRWGDHERFGALIGRNMELRRSLGSLPAGSAELVDLAESLEVPATIAGSGGAIVGVYGDAEHLATLEAAFRHLDANVLALTSVR